MLLATFLWRLNGITANIVLNVLYLNCKVQLFKWLFSQVSAGKMQTLLLPSDRKSGPGIAPLQMLYIMALTYIFKIANFEK